MPPPPPFLYWFFRGLGDEPLLVQRFDAPQDPGWDVLDPMFVVAYLDGWLLDSEQRARLYDVYAELFGALGPNLWGLGEEHLSLRPRLRQAFERQDLIVLAPRRRSAQLPGQPTVPVQPPPPPPPPPPPLLLGDLGVLVIDQTTGEAVDGASLSAKGPQSVRGTTDKDGIFIFHDLLPGSYAITATKARLGSDTRSATVIAGASVSAPTAGINASSGRKRKGTFKARSGLVASSGSGDTSSAAGPAPVPPTGPGTTLFLASTVISLEITDAVGGPAPDLIFMGRQSVTLHAVVDPPFGTYSWHVIGAPVVIVGPTNTEDLKLRAHTISAFIDDIEVFCEYTLGDQVEDSVKLTALRVHLDVDADRDGVVEEDNPRKSTWTWGKAGAGAVVLCNGDDDDGSLTPDNIDSIVNGAADVDDLAPLVVRATGPLKPDHSLVLIINSELSRWRIFDARAATARVAIGPLSPAIEFKIPNPMDESTLGVEATDFPDAGSDPVLELHLVLRAGRTDLIRDTVQMRVAPWLVGSHDQGAATIFVDNTGLTAAAGIWDQTPFLDGLRALASAAGCALVEDTDRDRRVDVWMQDGMEIGCTSMPGKGIHAVFRNARNRENDGFSRTLLARDVGWFTKGTSRASFNYGGNLEVSPPVTVGGKLFPLGRLVYGSRSRRREIMDLAPFLRAQQVQSPIELDTTWLGVGHVDEFLTFLPAPDGGFRLVMASPALAVDILKRLQAAGEGASPVLSGRFVKTPGTRRVIAGETTVDAVLDSARMMNFNAFVATKIAAERAKLVAKLGIADGDIIDLPILYTENLRDKGLADAFTGGVVNMLVVNGHCGIAMPFGPVVKGVDEFAREVQSRLAPLGLTLHFLDDWYRYHIQLGEVHCGTNTMRSETMFDWWEFEP